MQDLHSKADTVKEDQNALSRHFIDELQRYRIQAGRPPLKEMERLSKRLDGVRVLPHSTVNDILRGKRTRLPELPFVLSFVAVCRAHAERTDARLDELATIHEWRQRWIETNSAYQAMAVSPVNAAGLAAVLALAGYAPVLGWWQPYREVVPPWAETYLSLEPAAALIRVYETSAVPDLLQTEEYARAVIARDHPGADPAEIEHRVELRMHRQRILRGHDATTLWAIVDEGALRRTDLPAAVVRGQVARLLDAARWPNVTLQVTPAGGATAGGPITILRFLERELPDVVYLEQVTGGLYPDEPDTVHHYAKVVDRLGIEADKPAKTIKTLEEIAAAL